MAMKTCFPLSCKLLIQLLILIGQRNNARRRYSSSERRFRRDDLEVLGQQFNGDPFSEAIGKSAYFSGNEIIEFRTPAYNKKFTIELWVKPDGGQTKDVPILNFYDRCQSNKALSIWKLGVKNFKQDSDSRIYFTLKAHRVKEWHLVTAHDTYRPGIWIHVAVVFNGTSLKLFINQAQVSASHKSRSPVTAAPVNKCQVLEMGGDSRRAVFFRGTVDDLRIWKTAKSQRAIIGDMFRTAIGESRRELVLYEKFDGLTNHESFEPPYFPITKSGPILVRSTVPIDLNHFELKKPFCGVTICDNPDIVRGYRKNSNLRKLKILRYRVVNLAETDGKNPIVSQKQIKKQHLKLNEAFSKYNITWDVSIHVVKNSTLRKKIVLIGCDPQKIGDKVCQKECQLKQTGYDGGTCFSYGKCSAKMTRNGKCDRECNSVWYDFDGGECCDERISETSETCFDPKSPNRVYMTIEEFKQAVNLDNQRQLNVFVANFAQDVFEGYATFPWEKTVLGIEGGTLLQANQFGKQEGFNDMVHELGHNLGLLHVHHGSKRCNDPCFETHASLELGDLCGDTNPTPENYRCEEPKFGSCGLPQIKNAPFMNYMGYGGDCTSEFTMDQVSRMHCYANLMYQTWSFDNNPSSIPLAPKILSYSKDVLRFEWMQSLGMGHDFTMSNCNRCNALDTTLRQFAVTAHSKSPPLDSGRFAAHQATGPPDAKRCDIDSSTFMRIEEKRTAQSVLLELGFEKEVIPTGIKIWVTYNKASFPFDLEILHADKSITYIGSAVAQCDIPYTRGIFTKKPTKFVRLRIHDRETGIDAVELISQEQHEHCKRCPRVEYIVNREPPFQSKQPLKVPVTRFIDSDIKSDVSYEYRVRTVVGEHVGPPSAPLKFRSNSGFCGDGIIQHAKEECDDGNLRDGDGCSIKCKHEDVFKCKGQPSICYKYEGDGICESFEKKISPIDCGFYVPDGFTQQWSVAVTGNPKHKCRHSTYNVIAGPPPLDLKCYQIERDGMKKAWLPCGKISYEEDNYWIEASFAEPVVAAAVVVYLASDGLSPFKKVSSKHFIRVKLIANGGALHSIGVDKVEAHCTKSPLMIPVLHDMTRPYHKTKAVRISYSVYSVAISSVALHSSNTLNPAIASSCDVKKNEYYNPKTHSCHSYKCHVPKCKPLVINNANIKCKGLDDGDTCKITCSLGYLPARTVMAKCVVGTWKNAGVKCIPVDCGRLKIRRAILNCRDGTTYKRTCTFHCIYPSRLVGVSNKVTCLADGLWSVSRAACHLYCPAPQLIENSYSLDYRCDSNHMKARSSNDMGTECKFQCRPGYILAAISSNTVGFSGKLTCNEDGKWTSDSKCVALQCNKLSLFDSLVYNCSNSNTFGSICKTVCPNSQEIHEVRCQENGKWSSSFAYCKHKGKCSPFSRDMNFDSCDFNVKGSCKPTCRRKDFDVAIRGEEQLKDITLTCMPGSQWYPAANRIYCTKSCNDMYLGDRICDCNQNNKHCSYDNGDCCAVTLKRSRTVRFRNNKPCKCVDPIAIEAMLPVGSGNGGAYKQSYGDTEEGDDDNDDGVEESEKIEVVQTF